MPQSNLNVAGGMANPYPISQESGTVNHLICNVCGAPMHAHIQKILHTNIAM